jgi:protein SCO1/2
LQTHEHHDSGTFWLWWLIIGACCAVLLLGGLALVSNKARDEAAGAESAPSINRPVPDFHLVNQSNQPVTLRDLKGRISIVDFIFTRCTGPCPLMSTRMRTLQEALANADVRLVSITVDPENDTASVLSDYAKQYQADPAKWMFLTGDKEAVYDLATRGFLLAAAGQFGSVTHSTKLALVDRNGMIRQYFDGESPTVVADVTRAVESLK